MTLGERQWAAASAIQTKGGNHQVEFWLIILKMYQVFQCRILLQYFDYCNLGQIRGKGSWDEGWWVPGHFWCLKQPDILTILIRQTYDLNLISQSFHWEKDIALQWMHQSQISLGWIIKLLNRQNSSSRCSCRVRFLSERASWQPYPSAHCETVI